MMGLETCIENVNTVAIANSGASLLTQHKYTMHISQEIVPVQLVMFCCT